MVVQVRRTERSLELDLTGEWRALQFAQIDAALAAIDLAGTRRLVISTEQLPTGCGKSTLLNVAAGLLAPSSGAVLVAGERLSGLNRRAGYLFQADALMPWRNARENVEAGLVFAGVEREQARRRVHQDRGPASRPSGR